TQKTPLASNEARGVFLCPFLFAGRAFDFERRNRMPPWPFSIAETTIPGDATNGEQGSGGRRGQAGQRLDQGSCRQGDRGQEGASERHRRQDRRQGAEDLWRRQGKDQGLAVGSGNSGTANRGGS